MRRIVAYLVLTFAAAVLCMVGCSSSSSLDVADAGDATETRSDVALPASVDAANFVTGKGVAGEPREVTSGNEPTPAEIGDGADSDGPDGYPRPAAEETDHSPRAASQPLNQEAVDNEATKRDGRADGDDPAAALIIPKDAEPQDEAPLNDGREAAAQPIPEGQRVAVAPQEDAAEPVELGRTPDAEPGAEVASPVKATPTIKPAAPTRATLSELPKSIQALDKDGDGQLGLYEWPREKLAEFKKLDSNEDGFLTPAELVAGQKKPSEAESPNRDKKPAASSAEKAEEKAATKTDDSSKPDDAEASAKDTTDKTETPDASADKADSKDDSSADDQPKQGS